jgi:hypothetical protein
VSSVWYLACFFGLLEVTQGDSTTIGQHDLMMRVIAAQALPLVTRIHLRHQLDVAVSRVKHHMH